MHLGGTPLARKADSYQYRHRLHQERRASEAQHLACGDRVLPANRQEIGCFAAAGDEHCLALIQGELEATSHQETT